MKEIRERISQLTEAYNQQLAVYEQIQQTGSKEQGLIAEGQLTVLLEILRHKEELLKEAAVYENQIKENQKFLTKHFQLTEFSLPKIKAKASEYYQKDLASLETTLAELIPVLEILEKQEKENEAALGECLAKTRELGKRPENIKLARRAYGKKD